MLQTIYNNIPTSPFKSSISLIHEDNIIEPTVITKKKYVTISEHPLIKGMNKEITEARINIENPIMSRKNMEDIKNSLINVFTKSIFIVQQIIKLGKINGDNESDLIKMTNALQTFNKICYDIYGCRK